MQTHGKLPGWNEIPFLSIWRASKGLSQPALAKKAGVSISTILHAEQGKRVTMVNLVKIARALEVPIEKLLYTRPEE